MHNLFKAAILYEGAVQVIETMERHNHFNRAMAYCNKIKKPLLRIGVRRSLLEPPNGDVTLDLDPIVTRIPGGVQGDVRNMPFTDKQFAVCFNEHVLEHLNEPQDVVLAVNECVRVADVAVLLTPSPYSIYATFLHPTHNLRLFFNGRNKIEVRKNKYKIGLGFRVNAIYNNRNTAIQQHGNIAIQAQAMVLKGVSPLIQIGNALYCRREGY